ncbi:tyrosine-type recombinase/integrase [Fimbriimonas ginsengisoli]|uniref:Site-specific recombinase, phage integrase family n=1 Tax=Fimbriimonas ginsengisoli Gsoil 348 TaxID=661478 RepID=A0A068NQV7_FIMGI|nr:tyrosine-type recombinase/integrase [Fimbriimonas ginsengisoli]AIE85826.1 site-specific recombinase, phage integrase family [Fimbriimonas ginsengisoli Gsoil 348]
MSNRISTPQLLISEALEDFRLYHRAKGSDPKTIRLLTTTVERLIGLIGDVDLTSVTASHLRTAMVTVQETPVRTGGLPKVQTVHTVFVKWRTFFRWCVEEGHLETSPMKRLSPPRLDAQILPALDESELKRIDAALRSPGFVTLRNRTLVFVMLDSAVRLEECAELRVSDLNLETGALRVRKGKGRKERMTWVGSSTLRTLGRYLRAAGVRGDEYLWKSDTGGRLTKWGIRDALNYIGKVTGVHMHPHKLRRTCALQMLRNGADIYSIQRLMGHSDLETLRKYLAQSEADVATAHARFGVVDRMSTTLKA